MAIGTALYANPLAAPGPFLGTAPIFAPAALDRLGGTDPAAQTMQQQVLQTATLAVLVVLLGKLMQNSQAGGANAGGIDAGAGSASGSGGGSSASGGAAATGGTSGGSANLTSGGGAQPSKNGFAEALLQKIGAPVTPENLKFLDAWQKAEGGSADNPFNTTQDAPGARNFNSVGVKRYQSMEQGLEATAKTLMNGRYGNIIAALRQGSSAKSAADALAASPWGTGALVQKILA